MKTFYKIFSFSILFTGLLGSVNAQRVRESRSGSDSRISRNFSRPSSAPQRQVFSSSRSQAPSRPTPTRSFNARSSASARVQNSTPQRQMVVRQTPERNLNNNRATSSSSVQNQRIVASRNSDLSYDRGRTISRNSYQPNYRNYNYRNYNYRNYNYRDYHYYGNNHYYGNVYGRKTWFMHGIHYRIIPRSFISIHFGGNPYYYHDGFFYGYYGGYYSPIFPPFGLRISVLPFGYSRLFIGGYPYYYYNGIYYRQYDNSYEVVDAPLGATVSSLPDGARSVIINGEKLYELNGTYYKSDRDQNGNDIFIVVGKNGVINNTGVPDQSNILATPQAGMQIGDVLSELPEGSKIVTINGEQVYETPDNFYLREENNNGTTQYEVVGK